MTKRSAFARKLKELRRAAGLTKYALAKRAGLSTQAILYLESGTAPSWDTVRRLARALQVSVESFDVGEIAMPTEQQWSPRKPGPKPGSKRKSKPSES